MIGVHTWQWLTIRFIVSNDSVFARVELVCTQLAGAGSVVIGDYLECAHDETRKQEFNSLKGLRGTENYARTHTQTDTTSNPTPLLSHHNEKETYTDHYTHN